MTRKHAQAPSRRRSLGRTAPFPGARVPNLAWPLLALMFLAAGCGPGLGRVSGKVTCNGQTVSGDVLILAVDGKKYWGHIGPQGTYTIDDVPVGPAKVAVFSRPPVPKGLQAKPGEPPPAEEDPRFAVVQIPARYENPQSSGLELTVVRGNQTFDIPLRESDD